MFHRVLRVQTWSSTGGFRLYLNNVLVGSRLSSPFIYSASSVTNFLTLGSALNSIGAREMDQVNSLPYKGDMDDFRVYSRELSINDVDTLYNN
jgi:hypothetical protein